MKMTVNPRDSCGKGLWIVLLPVLLICGVKTDDAEEFCTKETCKDNTNVDDPYVLMFTSNRDEFINIPIQFDPPRPDWIQGSLLRNGVGAFEVGKRKLLHAFDGYAKLSSWRFNEGGVWFTNRMLDTYVYNASQDVNDITPFFSLSGVDPPFSYFDKMSLMSNQHEKYNPCVNVWRIGKPNQGTFIAATDTWVVYQIDSLKLTTVSPINAKIPQRARSSRFSFLDTISTAHQLREHGSHNTVNIFTSLSIIPGIPHRLSVIRYTSAHDREAIASWGVDYASYMHSFSLTENYAILFANPWLFDWSSLLTLSDAFTAFQWKPELGTKVYVVNIKSGKVHTIEAESIVIMHHANAYEDDNGEIVFDACTHESPTLFGSFTSENMLNYHKRNTLKFDKWARFARYRLNLDSATIHKTFFEDTKSAESANHFEFPIINENYRSVKYCYCYGVAYMVDGKAFSDSAVIKKNVCHPGRDQIWYRKKHFPTEPMFVPHPAGESEDHGVLLVPVQDGERNKTYLAIIDARTMNVISTGYSPTTVPYSFHGQFFEDVL